MNEKTLKLFGAIILCAVCALLVFRACNKSAKAPANLLPAEGAGRAMALEAVKLATASEPIVILTHDPELHARYATQLEAFLTKLKKEGDGLSTQIEIIPEERLSPERGGLPPALYHELRKKTGADCIWVSMLGAPWIESVDQLKSGEAIPRVIALDVPPGTEKALFAEDLLDVAIQYRNLNAKKGPKKGKTADDAFAYFYHVKRK